MTRFLSLSAVVLFISGAFTSGPAWSKEDPEKIVRYRQLILGSMGRHMGALSMIAKGEVANKGDVVFHATAMHESAKSLKGLFPESTHPSKVERETESLPIIWEKPDDFAAALKSYQDATAKLIEAGKTDDLDKIMEAFKGVGGSCGNCHETFRKDDD